jgi:hypothetical protein
MTMVNLLDEYYVVHCLLSGAYLIYTTFRELRLLASNDGD